MIAYLQGRERALEPFGWRGHREPCMPSSRRASPPKRTCRDAFLEWRRIEWGDDETPSGIRGSWKALGECACRIEVEVVARTRMELKRARTMFEHWAQASGAYRG